MTCSGVRDNETSALSGGAPQDRNKTLTALAGAGPVTGAQHPAVPGPWGSYGGLTGDHALFNLPFGARNPCF